MNRIILTVTNDLTYDQRMIRICSSLAGNGYDVLLVGRKRKGSIGLTERPFHQKRLPCFFEKGKLFYLEYNIRLFFYLYFQKAAVIVAIDLDTILPCFYAAQIKGRPLVYDAHEYFTEVPEVVNRYWIKKVWASVAEHTIPNIKYAYTVGEGLAKIFSKEYGIPFEVIRNVPFAKPQVNQAYPTKDKIILYQGVLNEGRGLERAIEVMQFLDGVELWLAGEGDLSQELRDLTNHYQLTDKVKFLGYLQPEDLARITPKAMIGLNLLENKGLSYYYSLANKAFDYIQAGVPSIQMNFPEYKALNETFDCFQLVDNLEQESLLGALNKLLNDSDHYERLAKNCLEAASKLTWEIEEQKLLAFYEKVLADNSYKEFS